MERKNEVAANNVNAIFRRSSIMWLKPAPMNLSFIMFSVLARSVRLIKHSVIWLRSSVTRRHVVYSPKRGLSSFGQCYHIYIYQGCHTFLYQ